MAYKLSLPLQAVRLRFQSGGDIFYPLHDRDALRLGGTANDLFLSYGAELQRELLNKGKFEAILKERPFEDYTTQTLTIEFPASKDKFTYPPFSLDFEYWLTESEGNYWGFLPVLAIESIAHSSEKVEEYLIQAVKSEFAQKNRLQALQSVISTIWFQSADLHTNSFPIEFPTPSELAAPDHHSKQSLLYKIGTPLKEVTPQAFGMEAELIKLVQAINNPYTSSLLLVGPSGVGKTTLIRELAYRKAELSLDRDILETTAARMIKELTGERGWQDNIMHFIKELRETDAILFVRNLRELFEVGQYVGNEVSVADFLQPFLTRGEITLVGESTEAEKSQIELRSPSYLAGFHVLNIEEPRGKRLEKIILDRVSTTAGQQEVSVTKEAIHEVVRLNKRFSPYAGFPGKPIRFLESLILERKADDRYRSKRLGKSEIIRHFCEASGLPIFMVDPSVPMQLERTDSFFSNQLFGQPDAVKSLVDVLASVKTALTRTGKPIASFLFVGPTGVGKTEFAKVLAEYMFGSRDRMERFDMSEYASPYAVGQLTGLIPGQDGILTAALRRQPFSVVLFDEIEKAHPSFYDLLLQVLSEGRLSDPKGQVANFCSSIIIMTSNIGASNLQENRIGWTREVDQNTVQTHFQAAVQSHFRPELVNRIDKIIPFVPLGQEEMKKVLDREIRLLRNREGINNRKMHFQIEEEVLDYLAQKGYDPVYGARYLQRTLREELIIPLARALNREDLDDQLAVKAILKGGKVHIQVEADPLSLDLLLEELEKANLADQASSFRRDLRQIQQGPFYIRLLSELDILQHQAKNQKKFWNDGGQREKKLHTYRRLIAATNSLENRIDELEQQLTLAAMGIEPFLTRYEQDLKNWKTDFGAHQVDLHQEIAKEFNTCILTIFGSSPEKLFRFYETILGMQGFKWEATTIWYRNVNVPLGLTREIHIEGNRVSDRYIGQSFKEKVHFKPLQESDQLCGVRINVEGPGAFLFLRGEIGVQEWGWSPQDKQLYVIEVSQKPQRIPHAVHRREFYRSPPPRREYNGTTLKDSTYGWKFKAAEEDLPRLCFEFLQEQFHKSIRASLL